MKTFSVVIFSLFLILKFEISKTQYCQPTITTASGTKAPQQICSGQLIFEDNFDDFDSSKWSHEVFMGGPTNNEFQWYVKDENTSFVENGNLHIRPRLTAEFFGEKYLSQGVVNMSNEECTHADIARCVRQATPENIISPIRSARIRTRRAFQFKYGVFEVKAKMCAGDWLWPAIWLVPAKGVYGTWPLSGEVDLVEVRSNRGLYRGDLNVGSSRVESTLHFGPSSKVNGWRTAHYAKNSEKNNSFDLNFHVYKLIWTDTFMEFYVDGQKIGRVDVGKGFWKRGKFENSGFPNPWKNGTIMAPFDQEFFIILNVAVGGTSYFSDDLKNLNGKKPWKNSSPTATRDFWAGQKQWLPTWNYGYNDDADFQIDYVRVWAL